LYWGFKRAAVAEWGCDTSMF